MVTDTDGYIQVIEYLTEHFSLFEKQSISEQDPISSTDTVMSAIEAELCEQIINVCNQNESLTFNERNAIIREVDAIVFDLEEILSSVVNNTVSTEQKKFIEEFAGLIKNLFDGVINS